MGSSLVASEICSRSAAPLLATIQSISTRVFQTLGKGFTETIYSNALAVMLRKQNIAYEQEVVIPVTIENHCIGNVRADFIVENMVVVELKAVARDISFCDQTQLEMYMRLLNKSDGILVCFDQRPGKDVCFVMSLTRSANT
jgi:GxxExxY protein